MRSPRRGGNPPRGRTRRGSCRERILRIWRSRRVSAAGTFRLHSTQPFLSRALQDEDIGLEEVADGVWNIVYYQTLLGRIDERTRLITGV
jgi:hypothetical protein